jgi:DNA-binding GntR family transcriptional regulator
VPNDDSRNNLALRDVAFGKIRNLIVSGALRPGERLIEESLGQRLGMSRNPVRESLKLLEREGFVTIQPYRGAVVSRLGRREAFEVFELREILDAFAARRAAENASTKDITRLRAILDQGRVAMEQGQLSRLPGLNSRFHSKVYAMAANAELQRSVDHLRLKVEWIFAGYAATRGEAAWTEHTRIADALDARDPVQAARFATDHVERSKRAYIDMLSQLSAEEPAGSRPSPHRRPTAAVRA